MVKITRLSVFPLAVGAAAQLISFSASAASLYWDPLSTGGAGGGSGLWDTETVAWSNAAPPGTGTMSRWVDGNDAVFAGSTTPSSVALGGLISVHTLTFSNLDYTITTADGAPITLTGGIVSTPTTGSTQDNIDGPGGVFLSGDQTVSTTLSINIKTVLSGSDVLTKTGTGTLGLSGINTFTGRFVVNQGFLGIHADAALGAVPATFQADNITLDGGTLVMGVDFRGASSHTNVGTASLDANRGIILGPSGGSIRVGFGASGFFTVNGVISGSGNFTKTDGGTLILTADNTYAGTTTIGGTLQIGAGGTTGSIGNGNIIFATGTGNFLTYNRSDEVIVTKDINTGGRANMGVITGQKATVTGAVSGTGEFWKQGGGTLVVEANANSNRSTSTVIREGKLQVSDLSRAANSALGTGNLYIGHSSLLTTVAGLSYTGESTSTDAIQNVQSSNGFIEVTNPGTTLTISNRIVSNTRTGGPDDSMLDKIGPGTLNLGGTIDNNLRMKMTEGTLLLGKDSSFSVHALANSGGAQTYALVQNGGTVRIVGPGGDQIYDPSTVKINGGTFDFNGQNESFDILLSDSPGGVITNDLSGGASVLTLGTNNGSSIYGGKIQDGAGTLSLVKNGSGSLTLTGASVLSGGTSVTNGRLIVQGSLTGGMTQVAGVLGGTGTVGDIDLLGGIISPGATEFGAGLGKLTTGNLSLVSDGVFAATLDTSTLANSLVEIHGDLSLGLSIPSLTLTEFGVDTVVAGGTKFTIMSYTGQWDGGTLRFGDFGYIGDEGVLAFGSNTYLIDYNATGEVSGVNYVTLTVVPEPGATGLLGGGLGLLGGWRRRRTATRRS